MSTAISITKETAWRGTRERFSNVYVYDFEAFESADGDREAFIRALADAERPVHSIEVFYIEGRMWSTGGTTQENQTLAIVDLEGSGAATDTQNMDREACFVVQWRTSRPSITQRPVTLKKWLHSCSGLGSGPDVLSGRAQIAASTRDLLTTYGNAVRERSFAGLGPYPLVSSSNSGRQAGETFVLPWIEHHEFRY